MRPALCPGSCVILRASVLTVISCLTISGVSANQLTDVISDSRQLQSAASVEALHEPDEKRRNSFRSDFGKRLPNIIGGEEELLEKLEGTERRGDDDDVEEGSVEGLDKRLSRFRSDFGKRRYRADFGKRRYRADFGKRSDKNEEEEEKEEGDQEVSDVMDDAEETAEKRARFRADLGKRSTRTELLGRPGRRFYRADLGKRRYRSDFG